MSEPSTWLPLPQTLREWRSSGWKPKGTVPRDVWNRLEDLFRDKGLILWEKGVPLSILQVYPHNDERRLPDPFAHPSRYQDPDKVETPQFDEVKAIQCPARTMDQRDVLIRLIAKGDQGLNHLKVLRRLAVGPIASLKENHAVPVLEEIEHDDMTFVVFPLMSEGFNRPWYYNFGEVVDAVYQVLQGIEFCHDHLVAHLDLDTDNILINFVDGARQDRVAHLSPYASPFREDFPVRYYINDFELAVCFEEDSDPSKRLVRGLPTLGILEGKYGRDAAPEMLLDAPYCPFRADVWQLGKMFDRTFGHLGPPAGPLLELCTQMTNEDPSLRPTASQAFEHVEQLRSELSQDVLESRVVRPPKK